MPGRTTAWWHGYWDSAGPMQAVLRGRFGPVHGEPAHDLPVRRGRRTRHRTARLAGRHRRPVRLRPGHPSLGPGRVLALEPADAGRGQHAARALRRATTPTSTSTATTLANIEAWTGESRSPARPGHCVPETMRFNGPGVHTTPRRTSGARPYLRRSSQERLLQRPDPRHGRRSRAVGLAALPGHRRPRLPVGRTTRSWPTRPGSCWRTPRLGSDGLLHTSPSNAHETQWDVTDPTTDIAAMAALFPATYPGRPHAPARLRSGSPTDRRPPEDPAVPAHGRRDHDPALGPAADATGAATCSASRTSRPRRPTTWRTSALKQCGPMA